MTQTHAILAYLKTGAHITPLEALDMFGCFRLGARVWDLRHTGYDVKSRLITKNGKTFAEYWLETNEIKEEKRQPIIPSKGKDTGIASGNSDFAGQRLFA